MVQNNQKSSKSSPILKVNKEKDEGNTFYCYFLSFRMKEHQKKSLVNYVYSDRVKIEL